jgi:enolase-phosphatase E1
MGGQGSVAAILTDIEGTTTPIAFVRDRLFPYARDRMADFLAEHAQEPPVSAAVAEAMALAQGESLLDSLHRWMDQDAKVTPLKSLQGMIWQAGYECGDLKGEIYPDVPPVLRRWHQSGRLLFVYSSGSEAAQRLILEYSTAGDLLDLFSGFFDTKVGQKREAQSYRSIAQRAGVTAGAMLFLSDDERELDAAAEAGLQTCQLVRPEDRTEASARHRIARDFSAIDI